MHPSECLQMHARLKEEWNPGLLFATSVGVWGRVAYSGLNSLSLRWHMDWMLQNCTGASMLSNLARE
jgi:hypothetical protein